MLWWESKLATSNCRGIVSVVSFNFSLSFCGTLFKAHKTWSRKLPSIIQPEPKPNQGPAPFECPRSRWPLPRRGRRGESSRGGMATTTHDMVCNNCKGCYIVIAFWFVCHVNVNVILCASPRRLFWHQWVTMNQRILRPSKTLKTHELSMRVGWVNCRTWFIDTDIFVIKIWQRKR